MKAQAIVYVSETGFTARYAAALSDATGLPAYTAAEAKRQVEKGTPILYAGWLFATKVKGLAAALRRYDVQAICAVGLCPTGELLPEVRAANKLADTMPLFTVQGGMKHERLRGINKWMIGMLIQMLDKKADKTESEEQMLAMIKAGGDFWNEDNLNSLLAWVRA